ncbi:MAG: ABC transporter permease [Candidatus Saccharicenans sp.]|nr:MAG: ABC transporter permease [Candidatus Aminicenantes bacterium]HEK86142.1 ABC transporter permease [Candidatus Aminicenantes bacterium]
MKKILSFVKKELIQIRRDRRLLFVVLMAPIIQLIILGYAVSLDVKNIPTIVFDQDHSATSRRFLSEIFNSGYFQEVRLARSWSEIQADLDYGRAKIAIVVPVNFERDLASGQTVSIQTLFDGTDSQTASAGLNYLEMITQMFGQKILIERLDSLTIKFRPVIVQPEVRVFFNPALLSRHYLLPGIFGLLLMVISVILTAMAIVKERDEGTMEQLVVTPLKPIEIIAGKLIPFFLIGTVDLGLILPLTTFWFKLPLRGSVGLLIGMSFLYMISTLGLGLLISTLARTPQQAMLISFFFMIPMILLSGFVFPIENMPRFFQWLTAIIPLRYYLVILRGLFLKGVGFNSIESQSLRLFILALVINTFGLLSFHRRLD